MKLAKERVGERVRIVVALPKELVAEKEQGAHAYALKSLFQQVKGVAKVSIEHVANRLAVKGLFGC